MNNQDIKLYNSSNEFETFQGFEKYRTGECARVYKKDNTLLKVYMADCKYKFVLKRSIFNLLKNLNIPDVVKLYDYYHYDVKFSRVLPMDAYTMEYIENDDINILDQSREYLIDTMRQLENTSVMLANNKIQMIDLNAHNVIFNKSGAKLIDVDQYDVYKLKSVKKVLVHNKLELLYFLRDRIKKDAKLKNMEIAFYKLEYLFRLNGESVTDIIKNVCDCDTLEESLLNRLH